MDDIDPVQYRDRQRRLFGGGVVTGGERDPRGGVLTWWPHTSASAPAADYPSGCVHGDDSCRHRRWGHDHLLGLLQRSHLAEIRGDENGLLAGGAGPRNDRRAAV